MLCLRYGWLPTLLPTSCVCDHQFIVEHALESTWYPCGGFLSILHNELEESHLELVNNQHLNLSQAFTVFIMS